MIEVYLNSKEENLRLPVIPPEIGKNINADISSEKVIKHGGINIFNGKEPDSISISCFFPNKNATYSFIGVKGIEPYEYVEKIEKWCKKGERLRYIVTSTPLNLPVKINHFEYSEKDGSGDVYYTIELKEDEDIDIPEWVSPTANKSGNPKQIVANKVYSRNKEEVNIDKKNKKGHTVKHGEYLYLIAQKYYGDGSKYKKITSDAENVKNYPKLKKSNVIYSGWKLVIP